MDEGPILICYDGSVSAARAIDRAAELFPAHRAVVLDVGPPLTAAESLAAASIVIPALDFEEINGSDSLVRAQAGAERARAAGLDAEARAVVDAPGWDGVVNVAEEISAALIVVGTRGLTGARALLSGSFSHQVAEHADRPVLIVPAPKAG